MTSKRQKAVALGYDTDKDSAPKVFAKGAGSVAEKILEIAKEQNIHVAQDSDLVEVLYQIEVEKEIPPELYSAVAEILAFVYKLNEKKKAAI